LTATATVLGQRLVATGNVVVEDVIRIGNGAGSSFTNGAIAINTPTLRAAGSTRVAVNLVHTDNSPLLDAVPVRFSSPCSLVGKATFANTSVTTSDGLAQTTYTAAGCEGADVITATATLQSQTISATGTVTVAGVQELGSFDNGNFVSGELDVPSLALRANDNATITANIVDGNGSLVTTSSTVEFSSSCVTRGDASFLVNGNPSNTVTTTTGVASITYVPSSCEGTETITATATLGGERKTASGDVTITKIRRLGVGTGVGFVEGVLSTPTGTLSAGGTASVSVNFVNGAGKLVTDETLITFSSTCLAAAQATFTGGEGTANNEVTTKTGNARINYTAAGCEPSDTITAEATIDGTLISAQGTINIASPEVGSIDFIEASPEDIAFAGSGTSDRPSSSNIKFQLLDKNGNGIRNQLITFSLSTQVGGITLSSSTATTNDDGFVTTTLNAGTVTTTVRVTATLTEAGKPAIFTTSNTINVNIGIADQNSFSVSVNTFGPNAYNYEGVLVDVTARAADKNNNLVPDGTIVNFVASFGAIPGSCTTTAGACTVQWRSQGERPADGLLTILARTVGEESFLDTNPTNGRFDLGELSSVGQLGEAFLDRNGSRDIPLVPRDGYDVNDEEFYDFDNNGTRTDADNLYNGTNCSTAASTAGHCASFLEVRDDVRVQMASDILTITINGGVDITAGVPFNVDIVDHKGNCPPTGTTITTTSISGGSIIGKSSYTMENVEECTGSRSFRFRVDATTPGVGGSIQVDVDTAGASGVGRSYTTTANFN